MKFMEAKTLNNLGYEKEVNNNIFQDTDAILLEDSDDLENTLKEFAYYLDSEFYFSMVLYDNEHAYSVVKIDGDIYERHFESKEAIESAMEHSYVCSDVAIFKLKDDILECIGY